MAANRADGQLIAADQTAEVDIACSAGRASTGLSVKMPLHIQAKSLAVS